MATRSRIKIEHPGAKNGGGYYGTRIEAKAESRVKRTHDDRAVVEEQLETQNVATPRKRVRKVGVAPEPERRGGESPRRPKGGAVVAATKKNTKPKPNGKRGRGHDCHAQWRHDSATALEVRDYAIRKYESGEPLRKLDKLLDSLEQRESKSESTLATRTTDRAIEMVSEERAELQGRLREPPADEALRAWLDVLAQLDADLNVFREFLTRLPRLREGLRACFTTAYDDELISFCRWPARSAGV